jgi:hypothetical protein
VRISLIPFGSRFRVTFRPWIAGGDVLFRLPSHLELRLMGSLVLDEVSSGSGFSVYRISREELAKDHVYVVNEPYVAGDLPVVVGKLQGTWHPDGLWVLHLAAGEVDIQWHVPSEEWTWEERGPAAPRFDREGPL